MHYLLKANVQFNQQHIFHITVSKWAPTTPNKNIDYNDHSIIDAYKHLQCLQSQI